MNSQQKYEQDLNVFKIKNKPKFEFTKDSNLEKAILFCKEFCIKNNCRVQITYMGITRIMCYNSNTLDIWKSFFAEQ